MLLDASVICCVTDSTVAPVSMAVELETLVTSVSLYMLGSCRYGFESNNDFFFMRVLSAF